MMTPTIPKNVILTGCSSGIGKQTARFLRNRGFSVFPSARRKKDVDELIGEGFDSFLIDLCEPETILLSIKAILEKTDGKVYGLINNAGFAMRGAIEDITVEDMRQQFETNLFGLHDMTRMVLPFMKKQGFGRIINMSSIAGFISFPFLGCYSASKFALESWSDALHSEMKDYGITVSVIQAGPIRTNFQSNTEKTINRFWEREVIENDAVYRNIQKRIAEGKKFSRGSLFSLPPESVSKKIYHALSAKRPRRRYKVTLIAHGLGLFNRFSPIWLKDIFSRLQIRGFRDL